MTPTSMRHPHIRATPWLLAITGLLIPLVSGGFAGWWIVLTWSVLLGLAWALGGALVPTPVARIAVAIVLLPILMVPAAWYGGWWLIPADLAWLAIEVGGLRPDRAHAATGASNGMS